MLARPKPRSDTAACRKLLREVTGAQRIYTGSLNEGTPHFHTHLLPRLPQMPNSAIGWNAFGLSELARRGEVRASPERVQRVLEALRTGAAWLSLASGPAGAPDDCRRTASTNSAFASV